jgi:hypothetical protein
VGVRFASDRACGFQACPPPWPDSRAKCDSDVVGHRLWRSPNNMTVTFWPGYVAGLCHAPARGSFLKLCVGLALMSISSEILAQMKGSQRAFKRAG